MRTEPETRSGFPQRKASGNEHSGHILQGPDARASKSIQAQPTIYIGIILHCMSMDMAHMKIHSTSQLEMEKKVIAQGCPSLDERCLKGISMYKIKAFGARRKAVQNLSDKLTSDSFLEPKL